jgi:hypothetical protein
MRNPRKPVSDNAKIVMKNYQLEKAAKYGLDYIESTQPKWFVSYPIMIVIMAVLQVMTVIYGGRDFMFFGFDVSAGWLFLMPLMLYMFQIVSECYGWQYSRQMIWLNLITNSLFTSISFLFRFIPESTGIIHNDVQNAYIVLMNPKYIAGLMMCFAVFTSDFVTSALMCWSRFHWNGKYLVVRIAILHIVSESIIISTGFIVDPLSGYSFAETWMFARDAFYARTIIMIALIPVARFVIWFIQHKIEGVVVFDLTTRFNPFKFSINPADLVQFNADGWDKVDSGNINIKKMAEYYSNGILEEQHQKLANSIDKRRETKI